MQIILIYNKYLDKVIALSSGTLCRQVSVCSGKTGCQRGRGRAGKGHPFREAGIRPMQRLYYI